LPEDFLVILRVREIYPVEVVGAGVDLVINPLLLAAGFLVVTLSAFRLFGVSRPLLVVAKPLLGRKQWVGEYVRH